MNREELDIMWSKALAQSIKDGEQYTRYHFATLVAAAEREACAKVCDELHWPWRMGDNSGPKECAAAIRARGQQ
jgi:hypothetical protein